MKKILTFIVFALQCFYCMAQSNMDNVVHSEVMAWRSFWKNNWIRNRTYAWTHCRFHGYRAVRNSMTRLSMMKVATCYSPPTSSSHLSISGSVTSLLSNWYQDKWLSSLRRLSWYCCARGSEGDDALAQEVISIKTNFFIIMLYFKVSPYALPIFTQSPMISPVRRYL